MKIERFLNQTAELLQEHEKGQGSTIIIGNQEIETNSVIKSTEPTNSNELSDAEKEAARIATEEADKLKTIESKTSKTYSTGDIVIIDDGEGQKEYVIDDNGNATLNDEIVFTKEQLLESENDSNNDDLDKEDIHTLISQISGLDLKDNDGNPVSFKPGIEGLAERETYIKNLFYNKGLSEAVTKIFDENPDIEEMYSYKQKHGSLEGYSRQMDYNSFEINNDTSTDDLKNIIRQHLSILGNDSKTIEKLIKLSENEETLLNDASESLTKLKELQAEFIATEKAKSKQLELDAIAEYENYYGVSYDKQGKLIDKNVENSIYDKIVKKGKIGNIFIPTDGIMYSKPDGTKQSMNRIEVFNYFYKPVKQVQGQYYTQAQLDESNRLNDTDNFLIQGIKNLTGNDISSLEKTMQNIIRIKDAKKLIKTINKNNNSSSPLSNKEISEQIKSGTAQVIYTS